MKTSSNQEINARNGFPTPKLVLIQKFGLIGPILTSKWQHVTFSWILNEPPVTTCKWRQNWIRWPSSHDTMIVLQKYTYWQVLVDLYRICHFLTFCHHAWIINEVLVNFKNWCHIWSSWLKSTNSMYRFSAYSNLVWHQNDNYST